MKHMPMQQVADKSGVAAERTGQVVALILVQIQALAHAQRLPEDPLIRQSVTAARRPERLLGSCLGPGGGGHERTGFSRAARVMSARVEMNMGSLLSAGTRLKLLIPDCRRRPYHSRRGAAQVSAGP